jgi:hypothetical protein
MLKKPSKIKSGTLSKKERYVTRKELTEALEALKASLLSEQKGQLLSSSVEGAIPYVVPSAELDHASGCCSFEIIMLKYGLMNNPALVKMARIVRAADISAFIGRRRKALG